MAKNLFNALIIVLFITPCVMAYNSYLTDRDFKIIKQNYNYYQWASELCDIPIEMLIAVHYREAHLHHGFYSHRRKIVVHNLGGAFMLDCGEDGTPNFEINIRNKEQEISKIYNYTGDTRVSHNFEFACLVAAHYIKTKARYGLNTEHGIADTFWGYNGRYHASYLKSSYVCSDPKNGNVMSYYYKANKRIDTNPGCLIIWRELKNKQEGIK